MRFARGTRLLLTRSLSAFYKDGCGQFAASISYYLVFTIFPLLIVSASVLGLFLTEPQLKEELIDAVMNYIAVDEEKGRPHLARAIEHVSGSTSGALGLIGFVLAAWSAANLFGAVRNSLNRVLDASPGRSAIWQKISDFAMVAVFAPFFLASIAATAAVRFAHRLSEDLPLIGADAKASGLAWLLASWIVPAAVSLLAFYTLYRLVPARRLKTEQILAGALVATVIFELSKIGFSLYVENLTNYDIVFGPLGTAAAFLSWIYFSACVMLFGAEVAAAFPQAKDTIEEQILNRATGSE